MATEPADATTAERYRRVAAQFTLRTNEMPAEAWDAPAPCEGWVARDVVGHLVEWVPAFFEAGGGPSFAPGPSVDDDPAGAWATLDRQIQDQLDDPAACAAMIDHPRAGSHRFDDAINTFVLSDVLVHTWDLARAGGLDETLDADEVHGLLIGMEPLDDVLRSSGQFGPRILVADDADEQTRLIAFTGRQP